MWSTRTHFPLARPTLPLSFSSYQIYSSISETFKKKSIFILFVILSFKKTTKSFRMVHDYKADKNVVVQYCRLQSCRSSSTTTSLMTLTSMCQFWQQRGSHLDINRCKRITLKRVRERLRWGNSRPSSVSVNWGTSRAVGPTLFIVSRTRATTHWINHREYIKVLFNDGLITFKLIKKDTK